MRVAALYDVHGNLPALEAVLADPRLSAADRIVVGGDVVAGPLPAECLELLRGLGRSVDFVRGNGDRDAVTPPGQGPLAEASRFAHERLSDEQLAFVAVWPLIVELDVTGLGRVLFCHATPGADTPIVTRVTPIPAALAALEPVGGGVVVCGHTHVQFDRVLDGVRLVNAGSVGAPYEGSPDACWALLGPTVRLLSTPYDASAALARLAATGYPGVEAWLGPVARGELSADEATAIFERRRIDAGRQQHGR